VTCDHSAASGERRRGGSDSEQFGDTPADHRIATDERRRLGVDREDLATVVDARSGTPAVSKLACLSERSTADCRRE